MIRRLFRIMPSPANRYFTSVGTRVRERMYEASTEKTTAIAIDIKRFSQGR